MKKFAVAIYDNFSCENKIFIVESTSEVDAMIQAIILNTKQEYLEEMKEWIEGLKKMDVNMLKQDLFNSDQCIQIIEII